MKKIFPIILVCFLLVNSFGYVFVYVYALGELKAEMRQKILSGTSSDFIERIAVSVSPVNPDCVQWESANECRINGRLYDIINKTETRDSLIIYCIEDKNEEAALRKFLTHSEDSRDKHHRTIQRILAGCIGLIIPQDIYNLQRYELSEFYIFNNSTAYQSVTGTVPTPPPLAV